MLRQNYQETEIQKVLIFQGQSFISDVLSTMVFKIHAEVLSFIEEQ